VRWERSLYKLGLEMVGCNRGVGRFITELKENNMLALLMLRSL
jgi:hypothetical protein